MKHYIVWYQTNYDLDMLLINAYSLEQARKYADTIAWSGYEIEEVDLETLGITFHGSENL